MKDRNYVLRAKDLSEAQRWIQGLTTIRNEAKANSIPEEAHEDPKKATQSTRLVEAVDIDKKASEKQEGEFVKEKQGCCIIL